MFDLGKYATVLFDLDGTLVDYRSAQEHAASVIIGETDLAEVPGAMELVLGFLGGRVVQDLEACKPSAIEPSSGEMRQAFRRAGLEADPVEFFRLYFRGLEEHGEPLPGVPDLLRRMKGRHILGVVTNGPGRVQRRRLQLAGLMEYLDLLVISCEVGRAKPDPEVLRLAMKLAGSETFSTLFVGDSAGSDMGAANAAGMDFVFIQPRGDFTAPGPRVLELRGTEDLAGFLEGSG